MAKVKAEVLVVKPEFAVTPAGTVQILPVVNSVSNGTAPTVINK
jgi:hypothetical protein